MDEYITQKTMGVIDYQCYDSSVGLLVGDQNGISMSIGHYQWSTIALSVIKQDIGDC